MPTSSTATVVLSVVVTGLLMNPSTVAWPSQHVPDLGIKSESIKTQGARRYHLSRDEQRILTKALFRSAKVLHRPAPTA